jgi:hypothetical protein
MRDVVVVPRPVADLRLAIAPYLTWWVLVVAARFSCLEAQ